MRRPVDEWSWGLLRGSYGQRRIFERDLRGDRPQSLRRPAPLGDRTQRQRRPVFFFAGEFVDAVGSLDANLTSLEEAINDWVWRASLLGFTARRKSCVCSSVRSGGDQSLDHGLRHENAPVGNTGRRDLNHQLKRFQKSLDGRLAGARGTSAIDWQAPGGFRPPALAARTGRHSNLCGQFGRGFGPDCRY